jgi:hypothetical protein
MKRVPIGTQTFEKVRNDAHIIKTIGYTFSLV